MEKSLEKILNGYHAFKEQYASGNQSLMRSLARKGQSPEIMVVSCCDSRVDPALILQCDPGDLFVVRNVANIVPPYEKDEAHHGTSAALEFAITVLKVKHLILLGHSQCGGINALMDQTTLKQNDFITNWVSVIKTDSYQPCDVDDYARQALHNSRKNCLTFPWIQQKVLTQELLIHLWFFDIKSCQILSYRETEKTYLPL